MTTLRAFTHYTPFGDLSVIIDEGNAVVAAGFCTVSELQQRLPVGLDAADIQHISDHKYNQNIDAYVAGDVHALTLVPVAQPGGRFQQRAWDALRTVVPGHPISYTELAQVSGNGAAVRAAGSACAQNRVVLFVPCHRVVQRSGAVGHYRYGTEIKKHLLAHEARHAK